MKKVFFHGITAGLFAAVAGMAYNFAYAEAMWVDFSAVINPFSIIGACLFGTVLASVGHHFFTKVVKKHTDVIFNIILLVLTFATFYQSFAFQLPYDIEFPELFAGLSVPLHMMPALFWLGTKPLFYKQGV